MTAPARRTGGVRRLRPVARPASWIAGSLAAHLLLWQALGRAAPAARRVPALVTVAELTVAPPVPPVAASTAAIAPAAPAAPVLLPRPARPRPPSRRPRPPRATPPPEVGVPAGELSSRGGIAVGVGTSLEGPLGSAVAAVAGAGAPPTALRRGRVFVPIYRVTRMPQPRHRVLPEVPDAFRSTGGEATVVVEVAIDERGAVLSARVVRGAGRDLEEAALAAARRTEFAPALVGNRPVAVRYQIPYRFRIRG